MNLHPDVQKYLDYSEIEKHSVFTILTTNFIENIDQAFYRRLRYIIEFEKPDKDMRLKLWNTLVPPKLPIAKDVDYSKLAKDFDFTGGEIKNAIFKAATKKAILLDQKDMIVSMNDFIAACEEVGNYKEKLNGNKKIGF